MIRYSTLLVAAVAVLFALALADSLILPISAIALGFLLLGYAFPELLESVTPYSKTVWMPLAFVLASIFAVYTIFQDNTFQVLMGAQWCPIAPCVPLGILIASFVLGSIAKFGTLRLKGEKLDLFGERIRD